MLCFVFVVLNVWVWKKDFRFCFVVFGLCLLVVGVRGGLGYLVVENSGYCWEF